MLRKDDRKHIITVGNDGPKPQQVFNPLEFVNYINASLELVQVVDNKTGNPSYPGMLLQDSMLNNASVDEYNEYINYKKGITDLELYKMLKRKNLPVAFPDAKYFQQKYNYIKDLPTEQFDAEMFKLAKELGETLKECVQTNVATAERAHLTLPDPETKRAVEFSKKIAKPGKDKGGK